MSDETPEHDEECRSRRNDRCRCSPYYRVARLEERIEALEAENAMLHAALAEKAFTHENVAAYLLDRADQYSTNSPCWIALADAAHAVTDGDVEAASANGDLDDDVLGRVRKWRR